MSEERTEYKIQWTTGDLASAAGVTPSWIRQLINGGELKAHKAGRDWLIPDSEARRFLRERGEK